MRRYATRVRHLLGAVCNTPQHLAIASGSSCSSCCCLCGQWLMACRWTKERVSARKKWVRKKENKKNRRKKDRWVDRRGRQLPEPQTSPYPYSFLLIGGAVAISLDPTFVKINPLDKTASFKVTQNEQAEEISYRDSVSSPWSRVIFHYFI